MDDTSSGSSSGGGELLFPLPGATDITPDVARTILWRYVTEAESRKRFAIKSREAMYKQLTSGQRATGARAEWIMAASNALVDMLLARGANFNATYPYDMVMLGDFLDVLATTRERFVDASE
jgi:hypothetical protein